jgi:hypothetical protein
MKPEKNLCIKVIDAQSVSDSFEGGGGVLGVVRKSRWSSIFLFYCIL